MLLSSVIKPLQCLTRWTFEPIRTITSTRLKTLRNRAKVFGIPKTNTIPRKMKAPPIPSHKTVAYWPEPDHLTAESWVTRGKGGKQPILWHVKWIMQRDARKRALATHYGPLQMRLDCLRFNGFLPLELRQIAHREYETLPRASNQYAVKKRCTVTSRSRGNKTRWRVSRIVFREMADHSKLSGVTRATW